MQAQAPKVDITVNLGKQSNENQQTLAKVIIKNHSGQAQVTQLKQSSKVAEVGQSLICLIKYSVYPGRQNQALKYLQQGFQVSIAKSQMSPLQYITRQYNQKDFGENRLYTQPGYVCVQYKFNVFSNEEQPELNQIVSQLKDFRNSQIQLTLKGFVSHSLTNRTNVKVDYAKFNLSADQIDIPVIHNLLTVSQVIPSEIALNPFYSTLQKAKKLHLLFHFKSFRQINKYFDQIAQVMGKTYKKKLQKQDFRYVVPGLFRQKVEGYVFIKEDFALSADLSHHGEQVFMRLVKVYFKAAVKVLNGG